MKNWKIIVTLIAGLGLSACLENQDPAGFNLIYYKTEGKMTVTWNQATVFANTDDAYRPETVNGHNRKTELPALVRSLELTAYGVYADNVTAPISDTVTCRMIQAAAACDITLSSQAAWLTLIHLNQYGNFGPYGNNGRGGPAFTYTKPFYLLGNITLANGAQHEFKTPTLNFNTAEVVVEVQAPAAAPPARPRPGIGCQVATADADCDRDGISNGEDNCPLVINLDQADGDENGVGDACDAPAPEAPAEPLDTDGDGTPDETDNCPELANADQNDDVDFDGLGNACDNAPGVPPVDVLRARAPQGDYDGDGHNNVDDNCPITPNEDQTDHDEDGIGTDCDDSEPAPVGGCHNFNKNSIGVYTTMSDCIVKSDNGPNYGVFGPMGSSNGGWCALNPHSSTNLAPFAALFVGLSCLIARRRYE